MRKTIITIISLLFLSFEIFAIDSSILIFDITGNLISNENSKLLSDRLRQKLIDTAKYNIVTKGMMDDYFKKLKIEINENVDNNYLIDIGEKLKVNTIIINNLSIFEGLNIITTKVISIKNKTDVYSSYEKYSSEDKLFKLIDKISQNLERELTPTEFYMRQKGSLYQDMKKKDFYNNYKDSFYLIDISNKNVCNMKFGENLSDIEKIYFGKIANNWKDNYGYKYYETRNGILFIGYKSEKITLIRLFNKKIQTDKGLFVGDDVNKLKSLYGEPDRINLDNRRNGYGGFVYNINDLSVTFQFDLSNGDFGEVIKAIEINKLN